MFCCHCRVVVFVVIVVIVIILIIAFIRTVTFKRGSSGSGNFILCDMHSGIFSCFYL